MNKDPVESLFRKICAFPLFVFLSFLLQGPVPKKKTKAKDEKAPKINFKGLPEEIGTIDEKQHIDQISPALTDVYINKAKYTDKNGVIRFKTKFNKKESEEMGDEAFDALGYHTHRRKFGMDEKTYHALKQFKDHNGDPYIDAVTERDFGNLRRAALKEALAKEDENKISHKTLEGLLEKNIEHHKKLLLHGFIDKSGLNKIENRDKVIGAIEGIVDKYHFNPKIKKGLKTKSGDELADTYMGLASQTYQQEKG